MMVGGEQGAFEHALPVFRAFGKNIRLCGPTGAGQAVKLVNQLLVGVHTAAIAEAAVFGARLGADPQMERCEENVEFLKRAMAAPLLGEIPFIAEVADRVRRAAECLRVPVRT